MIEKEESGGAFGKWFIDENHLPAYKYTCNQYTDPLAKTPTTYGFSIDHFHQIGNDNITATVHNGGHVQFLESSRGIQWLTFQKKARGKLGGGIAIVNEEKEKDFISDLYDKNSHHTFELFDRIFGIGYFRKEIKVHEIGVVHDIIAPFSNDPVLISEITVINESQKEVKTLTIIDFWDIYIHHVLKSLIVTWRNRKKYGHSKILNVAGRLLKLIQRLSLTDTESSRKRFDDKFKFNFEYDPNLNALILRPYYSSKIPVRKEQEAKHNYYPKSIFLAMIQGDAERIFFEQEKIIKKNHFEINWRNADSPDKNIRKNSINNPCLAIGTRITLKPGEVRKISCIFGYEEKKKISSFLSTYEHLCKNDSLSKWNAQQWKKSMIFIDLEDFPWLERESKWHSYYVRSACYFDEYWRKHKFPQGSVYEFGHGFDGAIRDFILYLYSIIFINPKLAKEYLTYALSFMTHEGKLPYAIHGFGQTFTGGPHSKPSDLYLFLIWGILQYIYSTRDFDYLKEEIPFYPKTQKQSSTVLKRLEMALNYLVSDKVGFGSHGLLKCNDGDWSDGISLMVKNRKKFIENGESTFNSAFAVYIIPKLIEMLKGRKVNAIKAYWDYYSHLKDAILKSWNGKWFYRGWDGIGNPIGNDNLFLEHHVWILLASFLEKEQNENLINEIYNRLDKPSPIGQYISFPAQRTKYNVLPKGWDVNGGIWHAINSLLTWAYSVHDPEKAFQSLVKNSLHQRAAIYPHIWYGIWSGPDSYIADYAENSGQAFYHLPTPMCDFPIMNLNLHACYLLSLIKLAGFEEQPNGIVIKSRLPIQNFSFHSPLFSIIKSSTTWEIEYNPFICKGVNLIIEQPSWWNEKCKISIDGKLIENTLNKWELVDNNIYVHVLENLDNIKLILIKS